MKQKNISRNIKSNNVSNLSDFHKSFLMVSIFALFAFGLVAVIFYRSNTANNTTGAQTAYRPAYDPLALFNQPIPNNYPTDSKSSSIISRISTDWNRVNFSHIGEVPPVFNVNNSMAQYRVSWGGTSLNFPANSSVQVGGGADHPLILLNTDTSVELRLWQASINHGSRTITASNGGRFYFNNDGRILNPNGTKSVSIPFSGAGTGSGLSYLAGLVTNEDFDSGVIRHAIRFANSCSASTGTFRPPATRTDQPHPSCSYSNPSSASSIEMGSIMQLDKNIDCNSRTVPTKSNTSKETRLVRMVCKAMQDYGIIMLDGSPPGGGANFYLEDNLTAAWNLDEKGRGNYGWMFRPPYYSGDGISRNGTSDGIPYNRFRVLARPASNISWGAGTPVPVPPTPSPTPPPPAPKPTPSPAPPAPSPQPGPSPAPVPSSGGTITVPGANPSAPVAIPENLQAQANGTYVADFDGDGLNEIAADANKDGAIDPASEIVRDETAGYNPADYEELVAGELGSTVAVKAGPLPEVRLPKSIAYSFGGIFAFSFTGLSGYLLITKLAILAGVRSRLGL